MSQHQKSPLRALSQQEERELHRIEKASSERVDVVRRAKALLAVAASQTFSQAASAVGLDNLAGHLSCDLVQWFFEHGVMPLYTPIGGSWLNMAESVQRIIVPRALAGQHPKNAQEIIDWLEQTIAGWNKEPTPFVWNGKRRLRRERARLRRLGGSGATLVKGYSIAR
jgi:hypothetical protein